MLVQIIKNWDSPDLLRQTPNSIGKWNGIRFTLDEVKECDYVVVLNYLPRNIKVVCPKRNIIAIMQEPYLPGISDWMVEGHRQFNRVYTHHPPNPLKQRSNTQYKPSQPALPWHVDRTFDELLNCPVPTKDHELSWITSNLQGYPGHIKRMEFLQSIQESKQVEVELFGRGIRFIKDKWDGLAPYRYSLAVENAQGPDWWTEKVGDCFLAYTVPFYYGCTNLEKYFPSGSFVRLDINNPNRAIEIIQDTIRNDEWIHRLPYLREARELVLKKYQLFPFLTELIGNEAGRGKRRRIHLKSYATLSTRVTLRTHLYRMKRKLVSCLKK
jgi:hypothetical protein